MEDVDEGAACTSQLRGCIHFTRAKTVIALPAADNLVTQAAENTPSPVMQTDKMTAGRNSLSDQETPSSMQPSPVV
jgi:hypothetical protein